MLFLCLISISSSFRFDIHLSTAAFRRRDSIFLQVGSREDQIRGKIGERASQISTAFPPSHARGRGYLPASFGSVLQRRRTKRTERERLEGVFTGYARFFSF